MWHNIYPVFECHVELINFFIDLHFYILDFINKTSKQVLQFDSQVHACIDQNFILNHVLP